MPKLQILIAAYGKDALQRIASLNHPRHPEVEYLINWQNCADGSIPESIAGRSDFKITKDHTIGSSNNRNHLLELSTADFVLVTDDDVSFSLANIEALLKGVAGKDTVDFLTFEYSSESCQKVYPDYSFDIRRPPKGYYVSCIEICLNMKRLRRHNISFNTAFGLNGEVFGNGEEDILIASLLKRGFSGRFLPSVICCHPQLSTSEKIGHTQACIQTKGACMLYVKPYTWALRMLTHAWRASKESAPRKVGFFEYCRWWMQGVKKARHHRVFDNNQKI